MPLAQNGLSEPADLLVKVVSIKGKCPVYREGNSFIIKDGFKLTAEQPLCLHFLSAILPYYVALSRGISPVSLGLAREGNSAFVQCLDPCDWTGGGTVIFKITPLTSP